MDVPRVESHPSIVTLAFFVFLIGGAGTGAAPALWPERFRPYPPRRRARPASVGFAVPALAGYPPP